MAHLIPAGTGEKMQFLVHEHNDNTIRFVLRYPGLLNVSALSQAVRAVVDSVDILHASFHAGRLRAQWKVHAQYPDHACFHVIHTAGDPIPTALSLSLLPISADSKTQLRCILVQSDRESAIALCISHLCVDGGDGKYLLEKLTQAYNLLLQTGSCAGLNVKSGSRATEQMYEDISQKEFRSLLKDPRTGIKSTFPYPSQEKGRIQYVRRMIPRETMEAARRHAKRFDATANDLLLAACYHAYGHVNGVDASAPMSITSMMDLRRHCSNHESEGLCNLSGSLPTKLPGGLNDTFEDTLADIAAQTRKIKENPLAGLEGMPLLHGATRTLPMGLLMTIAGKIYGTMSVGLTNLGNIDCASLAMDGLVPSEGWFGGPLKQKPAMQVSAASFDGNCALTVYGCYTDEDAAVLQSFLDRMAKEIADFAVRRNEEE